MIDAGLAILIPLVIVTLLDLLLVLNIVQKGFETISQKVFFSFALAVFLQQFLSVFSYTNDLGFDFGLHLPTLYVLTIVGSIAIAACSFFWFIYLRLLVKDRTFHQTDLKVIFCIPIFFYILLVLTTPYTHWVFYFDETGCFHNGSLFYMQHVCPFAYALFAIWIGYRTHRSSHRNKVRTLLRYYLYYLVPVTIGSIIQVTFFRGGYTQMGISASLLLMYLQTYLEEVNQNRYLRSLQTLNDQLREANEAKTRFLNNMSHDIRTPMNAILGFTDLIEKHKDDQELIDDYLKKIRTSGEYLLTIINNILDLSRIESGKETVDMEFYDFDDENNSTLPLVESLIRQKKIHFTAMMDVKHKYVWCDRTKIMQIGVNLLSNAIKYTPEGGSVSISMVEHPCDIPGYGRYVLTVSDSGIGMSREFAKHVFDSFSRERNTTESKIIGTGLGMSIVKKLVDLMNGTIEVESQLGKGTTFTVSINNQFVENPEEYIKQSLTKVSHQKSLEGKHILLAEDNDLNAEISLAMLSDLGVEVVRVEDGVECVKTIIENPADRFDVVLMDIQMPNLNGYLATRKIRLLDDPAKASIPIIAMTANAFDEDRKLALAAGMNAHIAKPLDASVLLGTLSQIISY